MVITFGPVSDQGEDFIENLQAQYRSDRISIFEDFPNLPENGFFVCFSAEGQQIESEDTWFRDPTFPTEELKNGNLAQIVWKADNLFGLEIEQDEELAQWKKICRRLIKKKGCDAPICEPLYTLATFLI